MTRRAWDHGGKSRHERGYGTAWERLRKVILQRDRHLCQLCYAAEPRRVRAGTHVDHILAKANGGTDDPANLQTVCASCHSLKTIHDQGKNPRLRKRRATGADGWPIEEPGE
jgi:5-methylcytosine-specific restriction protein A